MGFSAWMNRVLRSLRLCHSFSSVLAKECATVARFVELGQHGVVLGEFMLGRHQHRQLDAAEVDGDHRGAHFGLGGGHVDQQRVLEIGRAVQQECRDRSRMPSSA
eukprot:TRINITY_DN58801_c0_g1_i1.p1 TRINITY_DN58801_c0_g1~~TRINITY_DN58801_c0_g1_i1.p1  ORF type:complete len:105 (-),score=25.71 TRINITY_DN58801_c0_g1_i1:10-324(-)